jgi:hypothetical protein
LDKGLVHEEHRRLDGQRPRHRHPLALPARELGGIAVEEGLDVQERGGALDLSPGFGLVPALHPEAEGDVLEHRHVGKDGVVLEHHGEPALPGREPADVPAADQDAAGGLRFEARDDAEQRGLPAAGRAREGR